MKQNQKTIYQKSVTGIIGTAWVAGLLVAGSDSPYMPWLNGMGLFLFLGASILLSRFLKSVYSGVDITSASKSYQPSGTVYSNNTCRMLKKKDQRVLFQYACKI